MRNIDITALFLFILLGVIVSEILTGRPKGTISSLTNYPKQKFPSLFIGFGISEIKSIYHIHHWMFGLLFCIVSCIYGIMELTGFFLGITLQGLTYKDRFYIKVLLYEGKS